MPDDNLSGSSFWDRLRPKAAATDMNPYDVSKDTPAIPGPSVAAQDTGEPDMVNTAMQQGAASLRASMAAAGRQKVLDDRAAKTAANEQEKLRVGQLKAGGYDLAPNPDTGALEQQATPDGGKLLKHAGHSNLFTSDTSGAMFARDAKRQLVPVDQHPETVTKTDAKTGKITKSFHGVPVPGDFGVDPNFADQQMAKSIVDEESMLNRSQRSTASNTANQAAADELKAKKAVLDIQTQY
ncbi:MAG: hypothetical protein WCL08_01005, partial [Verrucomicrobiota bacterium]